MRRIDADSLKKTMLNYIDCENCTHKDTTFCADRCTAYDFLVMLEEAPTIEEKSYAMGYQDGLEDGLNDIRQKGEWLGVVCESGGFYHGTCSICKVRNDIPAIPNAHFCPNCGADMRGNK